MEKQADAGKMADGLVELDRQLCFALYSASGLLTKLYRPHLEPLGLTYPQYLAMLALWEKSPRTVGDIAVALGLDAATLTPLLKRLEQGGFVRRSRDTKDERRVLVEPTAEGIALRAKVRDAQRAVWSNLPWSLQQIAELRDRVGELNGILRPLV
jgi:DNA-binding MarR family transcriptional regulator